MSSLKTKTVIRRVLEETGYAYTISCESDHTNADYAEYASAHALSSFQQALKDPELTYEQLCKLLRRATSRENGRHCKTPWSVFMANCLEKHGNSNKSGGIN